MKWIIWGHPLHSHTQSYVHQGWYRALQAMGHEVYWLPNKPVSDASFFDNSVVITEGYDDSHLPLRTSSTYFVHVCHKPEKYLGRVGRLLDMRWHVDQQKDENYDYRMDYHSTESIGPAMRYQPMAGYDAVYATWATDLLPNEINLDDAMIRRADPRVIYYVGTLSDSGRCENMSKVGPFIEACRERGIAVYHSDPWRKPISDADNRRLIQASLLAPDIRSREHLWNGYVACRIFKNISYGQLGLTNSPHAYRLLEGEIILEEDTSKLLETGLLHYYNTDLIQRAMKLVRDKHTYINRVESLLKVL